MLPFNCAENNYQQDKCEHVIERMLDCCTENAKDNFASCDGFKFQVVKRQKAQAQAASKAFK